MRYLPAACGGPRPGLRSRRSQPSRPPRCCPLALRDLRLNLALEAGFAVEVTLVFEVEFKLNVAIPGELLQVVTLDVIRIGEADGPEPKGGQPLVDLVEVVADELLLGVGGLALVRLAGVLEGGVVETIAT